MTFIFYTLNEYLPTFTFSCGGNGLWDDMCESIADHVLGSDPHSGVKASDLVEIVEMETPDHAEYVEAVYVQGKLVGSLGSPFWMNPAEYVKI
jgi:hypothetical protein